MKVAQSCLTLYAPMDCTVHGILQARILEWVAFPFSGGSSQPRDQTQIKPKGIPRCRQILYQLSHKGSPRILEWVAYPQTGVSCIAGEFFTNLTIREASFSYLEIKVNWSHSLVGYQFCQ